jgi:diguanylate cyclase (GGDEF)-like protein/PAS domain S-box-containing protein
MTDPSATTPTSPNRPSPATGAPSRSATPNGHWFAALEAISSDGVYLIGPDGEIHYAGPEGGPLHRREADTDLLGVQAFGFIHELDEAATLRALDELRDAPGSHATVEIRVAAGNGQTRWIEARGLNLLGDPEVAGILISVRDVTDRHEAQELLRQSEERFRALLEHSSDAVLLLDTHQQVRYASPAVEHLFGRPVDELTGRQMSPSFLHPDDRRALGHRLVDLFATPAGILTFEARVRDAASRYRWAEISMRNLVDDPRVAGIVVHVRDIDPLLHDDLTGLPNRPLLRRLLERELERADASSLGLVLVDLDRFRLVNDSLGHDQGDALLVLLADRLRSVVHDDELLARLGGDEFVILSTRLSGHEQAVELAERVLEAISEPFVLDGNDVHIGASIGIAFPDAEVGDATDLLRDADAAMYRAKARGRGRWELFDSRLHDDVRERLRLQNELRRALADGAFRLHYQPVFALADGAVVGVEALLRWEHPTEGLLAPGRFVPIAEDTGLIVPIGAWVLREACQQVRRWHQELPELGPLRVSVNLSARQLTDPDLLATVRSALVLSELPADQLELEVTESALMEDTEAAATALADLRDLGVRLAIDDFGTGYSSMAYLRRFRVETLKVDRSFVDGLGDTGEDGGDDTAIVTAVVTLAHTLGLQATAEGVETQDQLARLRRLHCDQVQGYLLARPAPAEELSGLLARRVGS